jgi:hypothetical protein
VTTATLIAGDRLQAAFHGLVSDLGVSTGTTFPWLSNHGHLDPAVASAAGKDIVAVLADIHARLGGNRDRLAAKRRQELRPDFIHAERCLIIELDEIQHFTTDRGLTLDRYPSGAEVAFDVNSYKELVRTLRAQADRYRQAKPASDFPFAGGRRAQRAYLDAVRDLVAPAHGWNLLRVPAPSRDPARAAEHLRCALEAPGHGLLGGRR